MNEQANKHMHPGELQQDADKQGSSGSAPTKKRGAASPGKFIQRVLDGSVLVRNKKLLSLPYVLLLSLFALLYIANNYYAQRKIRDLNKLESSMIELRYEYRTTNSRLMFESKQSEVARKLEKTGIRESTEPPKKLYTQRNKK